MIKIPCETIHRFAHVSRIMRLDRGQLMVTDRQYMAVENISSAWADVVHIEVDDALLAQCETEAQFSGFVEILNNDALGYTCAKTMLGYITGNIRVADHDRDLDRWRSLLEQSREPLETSTAGIGMDVEGVLKLVKTSPSGMVMFEKYVDPRNRPTLVRDVNNENWIGCFMSYVKDDKHHMDAALPGWFTV